jgi:Kef-type K+ transport system membrane component KefB/nucleotide-binding universal stress UspA family protein
VSLLALQGSALPVTDPVLIVALALAIFLLAPLLVQQFRLPGIIGVIIAGAVVGPNGLNLLDRSPTIVLLGTVGLLYLMFMAGAEIDLQGFRRHRGRSLLFGTLSFILPQSIGTGVGLGLGYAMPTAILLGSMFASHTLVSYPIALRYGIGKNIAVTTAVGGTIVTDTSALLILAVVAASTTGNLDAAFWIRLAIMLAVFMALVWLGLPRLARWFFRRERTTGVNDYLFVLTAVFAGAFLANFAGLQAIVGAFMVGLALNRLIPETALLTNRIHFVGDAIFIPFFLLSVGMLVDVRIFAGSPQAWKVMIAMIATVTGAKWLAAKTAQHLAGYSPDEGTTMFGLSVPQAAGTLAATLIGIQIGLFDDAVLNGAVMMIIVTCILGPSLVEKYGRRIALAEAQKPYDPEDAPQRILVPMANPRTAPALMELALTIREPDSTEPVFPLMVVPAETEMPAEHVAAAEKMLRHAVEYAVAADVPAIPLTRVDSNFAEGIARGAAESRASTLVIGWDGKRAKTRRIFGSVLDQLLERSIEQVLVARLAHPLNTTERIIVLIPQGADHLDGFFRSVRAIKLMASRLAAGIVGYVVDESPDAYAAHFAAVKPEAPGKFGRVESWGYIADRLPLELRPDDLVVVIGARNGTVAWVPELDRLPGLLVDLAPESFIIMYPSEPLEAKQPVHAVALQRGGAG